MSVRNDYLDKIEQVKKFSEHYYHKNESLISDQAYDLIVEEIKRAGEENNWTEHLPLVEEVAAGTVDYEADIKHETRMLSLNKVNDKEELAKFIQKANPNSESDFFVIEPKLDGLAFRVFYKNGKREVVSTRGDSYYGKNVTLRANELNIKGLPKTISSKESFEVRGELFVTNENFKNVQEFRRKRQEDYEIEKKLAKVENRRAKMTKPSEPFSLQRSAVSGSINAKQGTDTTGIILTFGAYDVVFENSNEQPHTYIESLQFATNNGIQSASSLMPKLKSSNELDKIKEFGELREKLSYPTDGAVIKVNSKKVRDSLGSGEKHPNWAAAYKYEEETKPAIIAKIERSVGKSGAISYVGIFKEAVELDGSQVGKATLNNADMIRTLDIRINDTVIVRKANGIIPEVLAVRIADREQNKVSENPYQAPTTCPSCEENLDTKTSIIWRCHNPNCSKLETIVYASSKKNLDVKWLGRSTIETLVEQDKINDVTDLFTMTKEEWENLVIRQTEDGEPVFYGKLKAEKTIESLHKSLNAPLEKIISSLNIRYVGDTFGRRFAKHFQSFDKFVNTTEDELMTIEGVKTKAGIIIEGLNKNRSLIEKYKQVGFTNLEPHTEKIEEKIIDQVLENENIVITGTITGYTRDEIKTLISELGGKVGSKVSSKTTLVVAPENERSTTKAKDAHKLGITIITPEEFLEKIK